MKFFINKQDFEDYEQELAIREWCADFKCASVTRNGKPKHIGDMGAFSLDEKIREPESGTFADLIGECDRGIEEYGEFPEPIDNIGYFVENILMSMKLNGEVLKWATKTYLCRINSSKLNS